MLMQLEVKVKSLFPRVTEDHVSLLSCSVTAVEQQPLVCITIAMFRPTAWVVWAWLWKLFILMCLNVISTRGRTCSTTTDSVETLDLGVWLQSEFTHWWIQPAVLGVGRKPGSFTQLCFPSGCRRTLIPTVIVICGFSPTIHALYLLQNALLSIHSDLSN